ncbi:DUF1697 domain-containing protein [Mycobacterium lepromatosis]|uniref:DUF1697 domain-containing protein n=1 Tax=Mycobacterium lepromatosis TaxID=480418 RepID=UPI003D806A37
MATVLKNAEFANVRTILNSGNVLLQSSFSVAAVRKKAKATLRKQFGCQARVLVYDIATVWTMFEPDPYERKVDGYQSYVTFVADEAMLHELAPNRRQQHLSLDQQVGHGDSVI